MDKEFPIHDFINCTNNVVYVLKYTICALQNVVCTSRSLRVRIHEHYNGATHSSDKKFPNISNMYMLAIWIYFVFIGLEGG